MRRPLAWFGVVGLLLLGALAAQAQAPLNTGPIRILIDGQVKHFDTPPITVNDRVLVPMRGIFESLHATVDWDGATQTVTSHGPHPVRLQVGNPRAWVGQRQVSLDAPARVYRDRVYVPLRFISESLGAHVAWEPANRQVAVTTSGGPVVAGFRSQPAPVPTAQDYMTSVNLFQYGISLDPPTVRAGQVTLKVTNTGTIPHALAIVGMGRQTATLQPGESVTLILNLKPGTYTLYCPLDNHRQRGMEATLTVTQ